MHSVYRKNSFFSIHSGSCTWLYDVYGWFYWHLWICIIAYFRNRHFMFLLRASNAISSHFAFLKELFTGFPPGKSTFWLEAVGLINWHVCIILSNVFRFTNLSLLVLLISCVAVSARSEVKRLYVGYVRLHCR